MWLWALTACAVLAAVFLVIALAQMEAGVNTRGKWLKLSFFSIAVAVGLIIIKPKSDREQIHYMPAPSPVVEQTSVQKSEAKPADSNSRLPVGEKSQEGGLDKQGVQGTNGFPGGEKLNEQLKLTEIEHGDPVLEEILLLKHQAQVKKNPSEAVGTTEGVSTEGKNNSLSPEPVDKEVNGLTNQGSEEQLLSSKQKIPESNGDDVKEPDQQIQSSQVIKAQVLVASLNVRDQGSPDRRIIAALHSGDLVEVINNSEAGEWIKVKLNSGETGWVMKKYIKILP